MKVVFAHLAQRGLHRRHHRRDDDVRHLARAPCRSSRKRLTKSTPYSSTVCARWVVTRQCAASSGFSPVEPIEAQHRIGIAHIESKQHRLLSPRLSVRSHGANAAGLHRHQPRSGAHQQKSMLVQPGSDAAAGLRAMHLNAPPAHPGRSLLHARWNRLCRRRIEQAPASHAPAILAGRRAVAGG